MTVGVPLALRAVAAVIPATVAATIWWMLIDDISLAKAMRTPFPYLMLGIGIVVGVPTFILLRQWLGTSLVRFVMLAAIAIAPACIFAISYFLHPRGSFAAILLLSTALVGTFVFWLQMRNVGT